MSQSSMSKASTIAARRLRFTLEAPVETPDVIGGAEQVFTPITTLWGRIEAKTGDELVNAARAEGQVVTRIALRWRANIDSRMRLVSGARMFLIRATYDPDGRKREIICLCREVTP